MNAPPLTAVDNNRMDAELLRLETPGLDIVCINDVKAKPIEWLWPNRIAIGKVSMLAGEGGLGKSTILCDLAARSTTGERWPDGSNNGEAGSVVILAAEDALDDTIKPRLVAAGAELTKVYCINASRREEIDRASSKKTIRVCSFNFQQDLASLRAEIQRIGDVRLVIVDPISSYLGKIDSHKNDQVRSVLDPLNQFAATTRAAFICNHHFSKGGGGANSRMIGSVAFVNAVRAAFIVSPDPADEGGLRRVFVPSKMNVATLGEGIGYRIGSFTADVDGQSIPTSQVCWDSDPVAGGADEILASLAESSEDKTAMEEAEDFLSDALRTGPILAKDIQDTARAHMISAATLRRAKGRLGVVSERQGFGPESVVKWSLPDHRCSNQTIGAQDSGVSTYGGNEHLCDDADRPAAHWGERTAGPGDGQ